MTMQNIEEKVAEAIGRELEKSPELKRTLLETIHDPNINDAQKVAHIAQNMFALGAGFFVFAYDHLILEQMAEGPFKDIEGNDREIVIVTDDKTPARIENGVLYLSDKLWEEMTLRNDEVKNIIGRYFLGLQVTGKLSQKFTKAIDLRISTEFTAVSDRLNKEFYAFTEEKIRAMALTIVEVSTKFLLPLCPNFCTDAQYQEMYQVAYESIVESMDDPSETPFIRAYNTAAPNALFLDNRSADILRIFRGLQHTVKESPELQETFPLDYMAHCMSLVRF